MSDTMSTKEALTKLNAGIQRADDGHKYLLGDEFAAGMVMIGEVKEWLEDFVDRVGDVKPGG